MLFSCTDKWDDHYDPTASNSGTLWQAISTQENLSHFASVVKGCGYDVVLDGNQTFSVFAPTDNTFTKTEADSLVAEYLRQKADSVRDNDNTVIRQFLQNHIAPYRHPVSSLTNDSITMMNSKYEVLTAGGLGASALLSSNALCSNGLLFTLDRKLDYFPNVLEYLGRDKELDSVYRFINGYNVYEFIDSKSVPGEIKDGLTHYLDSVTELTNPLLASYGEINSEDSTYWLICPTNSEWNRLVAEYEPYFNYPNNVARRDSLVYTHTRLAIMGGNFFSRTVNPEPAFQDSAVSTRASSSLLRLLLGQERNYYTYYKPFAEGGVFHGTEDIVCSNGHVRKASHFNVSKYDTFMQTIKVEAESMTYLDSLVDAVDPVTVREVTSDNPFYNKISGNSYVEVVPEQATSQVKVQFKIPDVLSGVGYDVYAVFVPATAYDTLAVAEAAKPCIVRSIMYYNDQNGHQTFRRNNRTLTTTPAVVDTVLLASNLTIPTCSYGLSDPTVKVFINSAVGANQTSTHSLILRLDCIIMKPHEDGSAAARTN